MSSPQPPRSMGVRIALTVVPVIAFLVAKARLFLPGVDEGIARMAGASPFSFAGNLGVFAIGVMGFVQAYALVELVAIAVPALRRLRHGNPEGRVKLDRAARGLGLLLAAFQAFGIAMSLSALLSSDRMPTESLSSISVPLVTATLIGGACISMLVADLVTRQGIVNGLLLLSCVDVVVGGIDDVRTAMAKGAAAGTWEPRHWLILVGAVVLATFAGWAATRGANDVRAIDASKEDRSAYRDARALVLRPWVPVPSSSIAPYTLAASILMLPATLANFNLPFKGVASALERDSVFNVVYGLVIAGLALLLTRILHRPAEAEELARRLGTQVDRKELIAAQNRALVPSLAFFALLVVATQAMGRVPFLHLSLSMLPVAAALALDAVRALRVPSDFVGVWQERRAGAAPVVRAVLEARGVDTFVTGAATNALFQAFAPYAPVTIYVPFADAERATKLLRHLLLGEDAPEAAPEGRTTRPRTSGWTMRARGVALGGALLVACGLLGLGEMKSTSTGPRIPVKLEIFACADETDVFADVLDSRLPPGIEMRVESVPVGNDDFGRRRSVRNTYVSLDLEEGETLDQAIARGEAWTKTVPLPSGVRIAWEATYNWNDEGGTQTLTGARTFVLQGDSVLTNRDVADAIAMLDSRSGEVYVAVEFTPEAAERFRELTAAHVNRRIAILIDGRVNSAPVVRAEIGGGRASITMGAGDPEEQLKVAQSLANGLRQN